MLAIDDVENTDQGTIGTEARRWAGADGEGALRVRTVNQGLRQWFLWLLGERPIPLQATRPVSTNQRLIRPDSASRTPGLVLALALMTLAGGLRFVNVGSAYDVWQDEVNYVDLSVSLRHGQFPPRFNGGPFLLHPPLFFALSALWEDVVRTSGSYFEVINTVRVLNIVFAIASAGLLYALGTRLGNRYTGAAAGLLFACDPYIMRQNGRALLETSTLMWVLAGYLIVLRVYQHRTSRPRFVAVAGGLVLGLSLVSKDLAIVLLLMPLGVAAWRRWEVSRSLSLLCLSCSLVPYAFYVVLLASIGQFSDFWEQETAGLQRILGIEKSTGFNRPGSPSLVHVLLAQLTGFGVTYLVCGLGLIASISILRVGRPDQKLVALVTFGGAITLAYDA